MKLDLKSSPRHIKRLQNIAKVISGLGDVRVVIDDNTKGPYFDPVNKVCVYQTAIIAMMTLSV